MTTQYFQAPDIRAKDAIAKRGQEGSNPRLNVDSLFTTNGLFQNANEGGN
jgi:hypothetical protein